MIDQAEHYVETGEVDVDTMIERRRRVDPKQNIQAVGTLAGDGRCRTAPTSLRDDAETRQRNFIARRPG